MFPLTFSPRADRKMLDTQKDDDKDKEVVV